MPGSATASEAWISSDLFRPRQFLTGARSAAGGRRFWRERAPLTSPVHPKRCTWAILMLNRSWTTRRATVDDALHGRGRRAARPGWGYSTHRRVNGQAGHCLSGQAGHRRRGERAWLDIVVAVRLSTNRLVSGQAGHRLSGQAGHRRRGEQAWRPTSATRFGGRASLPFMCGLRESERAALLDRRGATTLIARCHCCQDTWSPGRAETLRTWFTGHRRSLPTRRGLPLMTLGLVERDSRSDPTLQGDLSPDMSPPFTRATEPRIA